MNRRITFFCLLWLPCLLCLTLWTARPAWAEDEVRLLWDTLQELDLETAPLDLVLGMDEKYVYVLTTGELLELSIENGTVTRRLAVDPSMDHLERLATLRSWN